MLGQEDLAVFVEGAALGESVLDAVIDGGRVDLVCDAEIDPDESAAGGVGEPTVRTGLFGDVSVVK